IAQLAGASPSPDAPLERGVDEVASVDQAGPHDLAVLDNARYADELRATAAGICLLPERFRDVAPAHVAVLISSQPYRAFVAAARALYPDAIRPSSLFGADALVPGAHVHASARLEPGVRLDPAAVIGPRAEIGTGTADQAGA